MLKLASWNVNSIKVRLPQVLEWLVSQQVDILALQETKVVDEHFPEDAFNQIGYQVVYSGQKAYNGVAIISKYPIEQVAYGITSYLDQQKRVIAATIDGIRVLNFYVPNGAAVDTEKYSYKMEWLARAHELVRQELQAYARLVVLGDFNIAPEDKDVHDPAEWAGCVLVSPPERAAFQQILALGLHDSFRLHHAQDVLFSWWDYRMQSFRRNRGLRIDHILLSAKLAAACPESGIDKTTRTADQPSDHAPVWVKLIAGDDALKVNCAVPG